MQLPNVNASSDVYLDHTDCFEGAAEAWIDAEVITPEQTKAVADCLTLVSASATTLRTAASATNAADRGATKLRARYRVRDVILDLRIMGVGDALLNGLCDRNHAHPKYRYVFDGGTAGDLAAAKVREEPELAADALVRLQKIEDFPGKQAAADQLGDAVKRSLDVRKDLDAAEKAENAAGNDELHARLEVRKALETAYGMLVAAFPGKRHFVESFFLKAARKDAATPATPGKPTTPIPLTPASTTG
ncbi:MAG: hypothetical protein QM820_60600 [Minicystis sp.]